MKKFRNLCFLSAISVFGQLQAQEATSVVPSTFDTVRVQTMYSDRLKFSSDNYGQNVQIISREEIQKLPVQTTTEVLSYALGVDIRQRGPQGVQADMQIQGSTFDQVLVLIDGVKMSDPQTGHHQMNLSISPEAIERIEIIKGAAARRYGLNALAGVVNIITRAPRQAQSTVQLHAGSGFQKDAGTNNLYANQGLRVFNAVGNQNLSVWMDVAADLGSGYRHNTDFQAIRSNVRIQQTVMTKNKHIQANGFKLNYSGSVIRNAFGANGFYAAPSDSNSYEYVNTQWGAVSADIETKKLGSFNMRLSGRANNDQYIFIKSNPAYYRNFHQTTVLTPELNYRYTARYFEVGAGAEYRKEAINSTNLGDHIREFAGLYADVLLMPVKGVRISGGVYSLQNKVLGHQLYPGIDINLQLKQRLYAFASAGNGQRLPSYTDLHYTGPSNLSNPMLLPEKARYYDVGIRMNGRRLQAHINVFRRQNQSLIDRVKDSLNAPWKPVNVQSLTVQGIEARVQYQFRIKNILASRGGISVLSSTGVSVLESNALNTASISQFALNYLPMQWMSNLQIKVQRLSVSFHLRYLERYGLKAAEKTSYVLADMRADYAIRIREGKPLKVFFSIQNLGNTQYKEFTAIPLPGRWTSLGVVFDLQGLPRANQS